MRRSLTSLPAGVEFAAATVAVTAVLLAVGLLVRPMMAREADPGQAVGLMHVRAEVPAGAAVTATPLDRGATGLTVEPRPAVVHEMPGERPEATFDGRSIRPVRQLAMRVTAYSPDSRSCGKWADGQTASGYSVWTNGMKLVAADTSVLPFGTIVTVPGYNDGRPVQVLDRGGRIKGNRLDVLYPAHQIARNWGVRELAVTVWEYAD